MRAKQISSRGADLIGHVFLIFLFMAVSAASAVAQTHTITATAGLGGSISPPGIVIVDDGADQTFNIFHDAGYHITDVLVDGASEGAIDTYTFYSVAADHTIEAQFAENSPEFETNVSTVNVPEGSTATFQVRLTAQPPSTVSATVTRASGDADITVQSGAALAFTTANWDTYQTVTLAAAQDADTVNGTATIRAAASGIPDKDVTATEVDNDTLAFETNVSAVSVPEGSTATFQVKLTAQPAADVDATVTRVLGDANITVQSGGALTFTTANWDTYQTVTLAAAEDVDITNGTATIRVAATGITNKDVTATEVDNDTLAFETNVSAVSVPEGSTATFQVRLTAQPAADVDATVTRVLGDANITVQSGGALTFTTVNWDTYQTVTLAAAEDVDITNGTATIRVAATGIANKDVTATEVDNDTLAFETNVSAVNVPEGSTATFQVRLSNQPSADVNATVTRASGDANITVQSGGALTFTTVNWDTYQTVTLAAAEDPNAVNGTATIRVAATGIPNKDVTATEVDNDVLTFETNVSTVNVPEGSTATFQVRLTAEPSATVNATVTRASGDANVTVQSGAALTFTTANWDTYQTVTLAAAEDVDITNGTATIRVAATGIANKDVTATEVDNDTLTFETNVSAVNVPEGSTATFQVRLTAQPAADVDATVTRASGDANITVQSGGALTFTTANWDTYQTVTLAAAEDVDITNGTATIRVAATGIANKDVTATEVDNDTLTFETNVSAVNVSEGSTAPFQVRLSNQPSADVNATVTRVSGDANITVQSGAALTFTTTNWSSYQTVTLAAAEDVDIANGTATIRVAATGIANKDVTATEVDNDTLSFVTLDQINIVEGSTAVFQVKLSNQPSANVTATVTWASGDADITVQSGAALTFTTANWNVDHPVTLAATQDDDIENETAVIRISASGVPNKDVTATEQDNDTQQIVTSANQVSIAEGSTADLQVKLSAKPSGNVTVAVTRFSGDMDITVQSGASLVFGPQSWNTYQTVRLAAAEDVDAANGEAIIRLNADKVPDKDITATEQDNDTLAFETNVSTVNVPEGGTATFQVRLTAEPLANVNATVMRASGDADITVQSGAALTFTTTNWNVYQTVTLAAAQDADTANGTATIRVAATGIPNKDVTATEVDNDTLNFETNVSMVNVPEGGTATFQVRLTAEPLANVNATVTRASGDADITVQSGASLTFTTANWDTYQTVTLAAAEDVDTTNGTATIRVAATGIPNKDVTATEVDNDTLNFETNVSTVNVPEGSTATFQVRLAAQPSADVDATVTRASGDADITVQSGASLTFTTANWNVYQTVTLAAAEDVDTTNGTATIRVAATGIPNKDVTATEVDNDTLNFETNVSTVNVPEGSTATFQVRLTARPSADVNATVTRASGDTDITVQSGAALTFTTANWDTYQTVTLAAAEDVDTIDGTATIQVSGLGLPNKDLTAIEQDDDMDNGTIALVLDPSLSTSGMLVNAAVEISDNRQQLAVFGIDLVFSGTDFTYKSNEVGTLAANWSITVDSSTAGRLRIRGVGGTAIPASSSGSLVTVNLQVNCLSYAVPTLSPLLLENYTDDLLDGFLPLPSTANFTFTPCSLLGDVNADGSVTPGDAQEAFEIYLGILTPTFCQEMTSDGNCSRSTTPGDAQNIFEHYLGMISLPFCCAQAAAASSRATSLTSLLDLEEARVILRERGTRPPQSSKSIDRTGNRENDSRFRRTLYPLDTIGRPNEPVGVPVIVSNPSGLRTFGFDVLYPNDMLEYWGAKKTSLTKGFDYVLGTEESPGVIHVEAESQEAIPGSELGSLVLLTFRVREGADLSLPIQVLNPAMDLRDAEVSEGIFLRSGSRGMDLRWVSFGNPVSAGESLFRVPVLLNELFGLKAFGFEVSYGPETAAFLGIRRPGLDDGLVDLRAREVEPGRVRVGGFRMSEDLRREPGVLVELVFRRNTTGAVISLEYLVDDLAKAAVTRGNLRLE